MLQRQIFTIDITFIPWDKMKNPPNDDGNFVLEPPHVWIILQSFNSSLAALGVNIARLLFTLHFKSSDKVNTDKIVFWSQRGTSNIFITI